MSYFGNAVYPVPLVNPANIVTITASTALTSASYGKTLIITAAGATTITLMPLLAGLITQQVTFVNDSTTGVSTINASGLNQIRVLGASVSSLTLNPGDVAVLENNGATWSLVNHDTVYGTTPAQFDTSTKLATTAFAQALGFQFSNILSLTATTTLTASQVGSLVWCNDNAASFTVTLPAVSSVPLGKGFKFWVTGANTITIAPNGSDQLANGNASSTTYVLGKGDTITLIANGSINGTPQWFTIEGSAQLGFSNQFGSSLVASGYQKLPSGLIMQWGAATTSAGGSVTATYPIAFPTGVLSGYATVTASGTTQATVAILPANSTANIYTYAPQSTSPIAATAYYFVVGH